ncbi:hypothetical protein AB0K48_06335 [Nonomuraea sp. NPDC055795]
MAELLSDIGGADLNAIVVALITGHRSGLTPEQLGQLLHEETRPYVRLDRDAETVYRDSIHIRNVIIGRQVDVMAQIFDQLEAASGIDIGGAMLQALGAVAAKTRK